MRSISTNIAPSSRWTIFAISLTELIAVTTAVFLLDPLWTKLGPWMTNLQIGTPITSAVDGIFYLLNAERGYQWTTRDPLSLLFHPLVPTLISQGPRTLSIEHRFWLLSLACSIGSLVLTLELARLLSHAGKIPPIVILASLFAPGGLSLGTANAEVVCMFFTLLLLLSVLKWQRLWLTIASAICAILSKPNALYMAPILAVYFAAARIDKDRATARHARLGILVLALTWMAWMSYVDFRTGTAGVYWETRLAFDPGSERSASAFFERLARSSLYDFEWRDTVRYATALIIPAVSLLILGCLRLSAERHRWAAAAGIASMSAIAILNGNPNKIVVYSLTLPTHLSMHLLFLIQLTERTGIPPPLSTRISSILYLIYCVSTFLLFVVGTPLRWYY